MRTWQKKAVNFIGIVTRPMKMLVDTQHEVSVQYQYMNIV